MGPSTSALASPPLHPHLYMETGFPDRSAGIESTCNAGDPDSILGSGRFPGEGIGYPLQYSWASLMAQTVKNPSAMQKTWVCSLGWEDSLKEGMSTHSSVLAWKKRGAWRAAVPQVIKSLTQLSDFDFEADGT